jgi:hypothetical protein
MVHKRISMFTSFSMHGIEILIPCEIPILPHVPTQYIIDGWEFLTSTNTSKYRQQYSTMLLTRPQSLGPWFKHQLWCSHFQGWFKLNPRAMAYRISWYFAFWTRQWKNHASKAFDPHVKPIWTKEHTWLSHGTFLLLSSSQFFIFCLQNLNVVRTKQRVSLQNKIYVLITIKDLHHLWRLWIPSY